MSKQKQKGTLAETAVTQFLKQYFPLVERRTLNGQYDKGDIAGVPNSVIEVKNQKTYKISEWMAETEQEKQNAGSQYGILVIKPNKVGTSKVDKWWAVMSLDQIAGLLLELERLQSSKTEQG